MTSASRTHPLSWPADSVFDSMAIEPDQFSGEAGHLFSLSIPAPDLDGLQLLRQIPPNQRFYWAEPGVTLVGSGVAAELVTPPLLRSTTPDSPDGQSRFESIRHQAHTLFDSSIHHVLRGASSSVAQPDHPARPRLFGGFAFSPEFVPDNTWSVFRPAHFILPHFQLVSVEGENWLTINTLLAPTESLPSVEDGIREALLTGYELLVVQAANAPVEAQPLLTQPGSSHETRYPMSRAQWEIMVTQATAAIDNGRLEKVVLSRVGEVRLDQSIDPVSILASLTNDYANCYRFLFEPLRNHFILGATPELLVSLSQTTVQSMALAGSVRRGASAHEDDVMASQLLNSVKDLHEHDLVTSDLISRLAAVVPDLRSSSQPTVMRLPTIQHLLTPIHGYGVDRDQWDILSLVELLHPTPALGGLPTKQSLRFLTDIEPVPRGWYAAPVGWLDRHLDGAFAVAIRSAVCQHERAWLYAGAGIVSGSDPAREWAETELKFKPMLNAIVGMS